MLVPTTDARCFRAAHRSLIVSPHSPGSRANPDDKFVPNHLLAYAHPIGDGKPLWSVIGADLKDIRQPRQGNLTSRGSRCQFQYLESDFAASECDDLSGQLVANVEHQGCGPPMIQRNGRGRKPTCQVEGSTGCGKRSARPAVPAWAARACASRPSGPCAGWGRHRPLERAARPISWRLPATRWK
jgi:hypothetical protein